MEHDKAARSKTDQAVANLINIATFILLLCAPALVFAAYRYVVAGGGIG